MCTLTWWSGRDGYQVFFNRDERRTRPDALPPAIDVADGVRFVAPIDRPSGGTWLLANEAGLTLAILNLYERELPELPGAIFRSRGILLRSLASSLTLEEVAERLHAEAVAQCNAFTLLGFDSGGIDGGLRVWRWQHDRERITGPDEGSKMPVCSSSFSAERVIAARRRVFASLRVESEASPEWLERFHHFDGGGHPSAETILMRRDDARTLSISRVEVGADLIRFAYESVPDGGAEGSKVVCEMARR